MQLRNFIVCILSSTLTFFGLLSNNLHAQSVTREQIEFFEREVRPLFVKHCFECHGEGDGIEAGLRLTSRQALLQGGDSGPAVVPGDLDRSLLIEAVRYRGLEMPPQGKLPPESIAVFERWVAMGATWPEEESTAQPLASDQEQFQISDQQRAHWSFQPVSNPHAPMVQDANWCRTEIDRFILAKLESRGLRPNPTADKRTLIRRVTYDLTGLPPTPIEIQAFLADDRDGAFEAMVERLLLSPQYGERWGRHWLDVVRYADTAGDVADYPVPQAYHYRDYVIDAFNSDKPYNVFLREQLAGDLIAKKSAKEKYAELTTATGYIAVTRRFGYNRHHQHHLTIADTLDTLGKSLLGLSIGCTRCHDHKFDPISAADYYGLYGIFASTRYPFPGAEEQNRPQDFVPLVPPEEAASLIAARDSQIAPLDAELKELSERLAAANELLAKQSEKQSVDQQAVNELNAKIAEVQAQRNALAREPYATAYAVAEATPQDGVIHRRGEPERLGPTVPRRFLEILGGQAVEAKAESGRRELAEWITDPENPLTARVMVNRIWQYHFGRGLVRTPNDFGTRGESPTHLELLDYLAHKFVENEWSVKEMHRMILRSHVYRLSSVDCVESRKADPNNDLFWRVDARRLDAECIRDAMLVVSGELDRSRGIAHPFPSVDTWTFNVHHPFKEVYDTNRRSVYLMTQRLQKHPFLGLFDGADPGATTDVRMVTTTPSQALFMMNDPFVHSQSQKFARRLIQETPDGRGQIHMAYELAFGRSCSESELEQALKFCNLYRNKLVQEGNEPPTANESALAAYLRTLLSSNEFIYLD